MIGRLLHRWMGLGRAAVVLSVALSCSDAAGPGGPRAVELGMEAVVLTEVGEGAELDVRVGGARISTASFTVLSEERWAADLPVLDRAALDTSRIEARAPGTAVVEVAWGEATPAQLLVEVALEGDVVLEALPRSAEGGEPVRLLGHFPTVGPDPEVRLDGLPVPVLDLDSASLLVEVPAGEVTGGCEGGSPPVEVEVEGAELSPGFGLFRRRMGEIELQPSSVRRLSPGELGCLRLAPADEYVLAFHDFRMHERARRGRSEGDWSPLLREPLTIGRIHAGDDPARAPGVGPVQPPTPDVPGGSHLLPPPWAIECSAEDRYWTRTEPWVVGERFRFCHNIGSRGQWARVVDVEGPLVFALQEREEDTWWTEEWASRLDTAAAHVGGEIDRLNRAFGIDSTTWHPAASDSVDQILIVLASEVGYQGAASGSSLVILNLQHYPPHAASLVYLLGHELAHLWQYSYRIEYGDVDAVEFRSGRWAIEGGASFFGYEATRRFLGLGLHDNVEWSRHEEVFAYAEEVARTDGHFNYGYWEASSFMRDVLLDRVARTGEPYEDVVHDLLAGSLEGWYGTQPNGLVVPGLFPRMREAMPDWDPTDAALSWAVDQAMDDANDDPAHQNASFFEAGYRRSDGWGWQPWAELGPGGVASVEIPLQHGASGYVVIRAPAGATYALEADSVAWMIARPARR